MSNSRKYLNDIGYQDWRKNMKKNKRNKEWKKERKKYGFDSRDTWNLDSTMAELLYERLKMFRMFNEVNIIDTDYHTIEIDSVEMSMQEAIDELLKSLKLRLIDKDLEVAYNHEVRAWTIWLKLIEKGIMWW